MTESVKSDVLELYEEKLFEQYPWLNRDKPKRYEKERLPFPYCLVQEIRLEKLRDLILLVHYFTKAGVEIKRTDPFYLAQIIQKELGCSFRTASDYANALVWLHVVGQCLK